MITLSVEDIEFDRFHQATEHLLSLGHRRIAFMGALQRHLVYQSKGEVL